MSISQLETISFEIKDLINNEKIKKEKKALEETMMLKDLKKRNEKLSLYTEYEFSSGYAIKNIKDHFNLLIKIIEKQEQQINQLSKKILALETTK